MNPFFSDPGGDDLAYDVDVQERAVASAYMNNGVLVVSGSRKGRTTITVTVADPEGLEAVRNFPIKVPNRGPRVVQEIPDQVIQLSSSTQSFTLTRYFSDPDGDGLTFSVRASKPGLRIDKNGAALRLYAQRIVEAAITVRAMDPEGLSAVSVFNVTVENRPPELIRKLPGKKIHIADEYSILLTDHFHEPDNQSMTYIVRVSSAVASALVSTDVLTLTGTAKGNSLVVVTAEDPLGGSATGSFPLKVTAGPPIIRNALPVVEIHSGGRRTIDLNDYFKDPDGGVLRYTRRVGGGVATATTSAGYLTITGVNIGSTEVEVTATDRENAVTAKDPEDGEAEQEFTVTVTVNAGNSPPVYTPITLPTLEVGGTSHTVDLSEHFTDEDGDELTYQVKVADEQVAEALVESGILIIEPAGQGAGGKTEITITADDGNGGTVTGAPELTVVVGGENRAPEIADSIPDMEVEVDDMLAYEPITLTLADHFLDPDNDELTYTVDFGNPQVGGAAFNGDSTELTITATGKGHSPLSVTASDPSDLSVTDEFDLTIPSRRPKIVSEIADAALPVGRTRTYPFSLHFTVTADDGDGGTVQDVIAVTATQN